ncbi:MAG: hypothetical protein IMY72_00625 [Bacteroidetes bacterium]|nr:hypothetical protein [Bacteroidota bacterium]
MLDISLLEWFGYLASVIIVVSMLMDSIVKLRWFNLIGAALFSTYGFLILALPVGFLNLFIVLADAYYIFKMYNKKEYFRILEIRRTNYYLLDFIEFHNLDIQKYFPKFEYVEGLNTITCLILRDMAVAGVFLAHEFGEKTLFIGLDYVIPQYRDLKLGRYIFEENKDFFIKKGYNKLCTKSQSETHSKYLKKMGFVVETVNDEKLFVKNL